MTMPVRWWAAKRGHWPVLRARVCLSEDAVGTSYAGIHESYVDVRTVDAVIDKIRLVWASLWSDAALLYRKEFCI